MNTTSSGRSHAPVERHERGRGIPDADTVTSLAHWTRAIRNHRKLTRRRASETTGISSDYLKNIETGWLPSPAIVEKLITGYEMSCQQSRMTWDLWRPPIALPPAERLRARISTPDRLELLARLEQAHVAIAYIDPVWTVLAANDTFYRSVPMIAGGNVAAWAMPPNPEPSPMEPLLLYPDFEARTLVGMLRGGAAAYRASPQVRCLFEQLSRNDSFARHWRTDLHVDYGRRALQPLFLRNPATGEPYALDVQITEVGDIPEVRAIVAWPAPGLETP